MGTNQSLVHSDLITEEHIIDQYTTIRCMHGDEVSSPLAVVKVGIVEREVIMNAAVSDTLPRAALLGWDMPELLFHIGGDSQKTTSADEQLAVFFQQDFIACCKGRWEECEGRIVRDS